LTTGAYHENGFAKVCDGFGAGWTKGQILETMRHSGVGTYGCLGLISIVGLKFFSLETLDNQTLICTIIVAHSLSRFVALSFIFTHNYVGNDELNEPKIMARKLPSDDLLTALMLAILPLFIYIIFTKNFFLLLVIPPLVLLHLYLGYYFKKWIGGYTSECLGATQQVAEVIIYLVVVAVSKEV
jgi:adenosylcobinamide-GDP ribazoletransferase